MSEPESLNSAIARILFGDDLPEDRVALEREIAAAFEGDAWLDLLNRVREIECQHPYPGDLYELRKRVYDAIGETKEPVQAVADRGAQHAVQSFRLRKSTLKRDKFLGRRILPIGIGAIIGIIGLVLGQTNLLQSLHIGRRVAISGSRYVTTNGQRATLTLPDGSTVALNVASRLDVPTSYADGNRTVYLSGEALFNVAHSGATPLTVVTDVGTVRVLGTSFVVRHYPTEPTQLVVVRDGKVAIAGAVGVARDHPVVLSAAYQAEMTRSNVVSMGLADPGQFGFATGTLSLVHRPLTAAIPELNRWYDTDIRLGNPSLARHQVTGDFPAGSLSDLVAVLELAYDVQVVRSGRVITLYPK